MNFDLNFIQDTITKRIKAFQSSTRSLPAAGDDISWGKVGQTLASGGFRFFEIRDEHLRFLFFILRNKPDILKKILPIAEVLKSRPPMLFASLMEIHQERYNGPRGKETCETIRNALLETFLFEINLRMQTLYRLYLNTAAFADSTPEHSESVKFIKSLEETVYGLLVIWDMSLMLDWLGYSGQGIELDKTLARLSNYFFKINRVNLRFTYHCNIACRHCYNDSGQHLKHIRIPLERMLRIIEEMPLAGLHELTITGGEPFLYIDEVASLVRHARNHGVTGVSILTNAFWAISEDKTREILSLLCDSGFGMSSDIIKASVGIYHQEFIPIERVLILAEVFYAMFGRPLNLDFERHIRGGEEEKAFIELLCARQLFKKVVIRFRSVVPLGRGRKLPNYNGNSRKFLSPCRDINQIVFDPDGVVRPCCGLNTENHGIIIGRGEDLCTLVKAIQNNPILQFLARNPIKDIFTYTDRAVETYISFCDACQAAVGGLQNTEKLKLRLAPFQEFYPFWFSRDKVTNVSKFGKTEQRLNSYCFSK
jgi:hypothetical protein